MNHTPKNRYFKRIALPLCLALSVCISSINPLLAAPGGVNSVNNGRVIHGGTYYNTPGNKTVFRNSGPGGLWLKNGSNLRGLQSNATGIPTGHGGTFYFRAPGNVVRLDGNIDVSALKNGSLYLGNGGQVFVDAAYLYQSGRIFANGYNGGLVQFNIGAATFGPQAQIRTMGFGGAGGQININASGVVDIRNGAIFDTSGGVVGTYDTNVINIESGVVNNAGILRANGVAGADPKGSDSNALLSSYTGEGHPYSPDYSEPGIASRGGTIRLVANGQSETECVDCAILNSDSTFTQTQKIALITRNNLLASNLDGDVINTGTLQANGGNSVNSGYGYSPSLYSEGSPMDGGDGGSVIIAAAHHVLNSGTILANGAAGAEGTGFDAVPSVDLPFWSYPGRGGNGGTVVVTALGHIINSGTIEANGGQGGSFVTDAPISVATGLDGADGGKGGAIAFGYQAMSNTGTIRANGGNGGNGQNATAESSVVDDRAIVTSANAIAQGGNGGRGGNAGLILFSGPANPIGNGLVQINGGNGGQGGSATAIATANGIGLLVSADASAFGGEGGNYGEGGLVVAPNPGAFGSTQAYEGFGGASGPSGEASATATAANWPDTWETRAIAYANSNGVEQTNTNSNSAIASVDPQVGADTSGGNNPIDETQGNEAIINDGNLILLSRTYGEGSGSELSLHERLDNATRRICNSGDYKYLSHETSLDELITGNLVVYGGSNTDLVLDSGNLDLGDLADGMPQLNTLTVLNNGFLENDGFWLLGASAGFSGGYFLNTNPGGGHLSWIANGSLDNYGDVVATGLYSGGSVNLSARENLSNDGTILQIPLMNFNTSSGSSIVDYFFTQRFSHGGSIILKAGYDLYNGGTLLGFGLLNTQVGNSISMFAGNDIANYSVIASIANSFDAGERDYYSAPDAIGGVIISKAGHDNKNFGSYGAMGIASSYSLEDRPAPIGEGGYIHLQGGNIVANRYSNKSREASAQLAIDGFGYLHEGEIRADGSHLGGQVILAAGGNNDGGLGSGFINDGFSVTNGAVPGSGTITPGIDTSIGESVYNFGTVTANSFNEGSSNDGAILMVANGQVAIGGQSGLFNAYSGSYATPAEFATGAMEAGGNLSLIAGPLALEKILCGYVPSSSSSNNRSNPNNSSLNNLLFNLYGLFQSNRYTPNVDSLGSSQPGPSFSLLGFAQPSMFLAKDYSQVTVEILGLALQVYESSLADGHTEQDALAAAASYLTEAGVDSGAATELIQQVQNGDVPVSIKVIDILNILASQPAPQEGETSEVIVPDNAAVSNIANHNS